ncbi:MAG: TrkA family potassium uptake protein, partial [Spirochaetaceae bacterium]
KDKVMGAFRADVLNEENIRKLIPKTINAAVIDLGSNIEASILVTNYLKKMGIREIFAKAETDEHGEILEIVGATRVVFPSREAAKRITPILLSSLIFNYLPISEDFIIAEIKVPDRFIGKSLLQINLRKVYNLNVIALRKDDGQSYSLFNSDHILQRDEVLLIGGREEDFLKITDMAPSRVKKDKIGFFRRLFSGRGH